MKSTMKKYTAPLLLALLAPIGFVCQRLFSSAPQLVEKYFSQGIYPFFAKAISAVTGLLPFSLAEILVVTAVIWIPLLIYRFYSASKKENGRLDAVLLTLVKTAALASAGYFVYLCLCGFNYARMPYGRIAGYDTSPASASDLQVVCLELANEANELRALLDEEMLFESHYDIAKRCRQNYDNASKSAPWLSGRYGQPKAVMLSEPWAHTQTTGMFFPFTVEANYNRVNSHFMYASTIAHEAAHQRGFMREDEANFIAWYVCANSESIADRYSGTMLALIHAMNKLYSANSDMFVQVYRIYSQDVIGDLSAHSELWDKYEGKTAQVQEQVNNTYLKSNMQQDGVLSYGRMVDLLIGYYRAQGLI